MVFVFVRNAIHDNVPGAKSRSCVILSMLVVAVFAYLAMGAAVFQAINPVYAKQGLAGFETNTTYLDAFYFSVVTLTTTGFGDVVPTNDETKIFLSGYIVFSLILVGIMLEVTDFLFQVDVVELDETDELAENKFWSPGRKKFFWSVILVIAIMATSSVFFFLFENKTLVDSIYFSVVTLSTVGYGDITPDTEGGKLFAIFWVSLGCLALFRMIGALMDLMLETRKKAWREARDQRSARVGRHLSTRVGALPMSNMSDTQVIKKLSKQDLIDVLIRMEYAIYKLNQRGAVSLDELRELNTEYKALTLDEIEAEFSMESTSMVFNAITGNQV